MGELAQTLEMNRSITHLDLRNNRVGPNGAAALSKALRCNQSLAVCDLRWNDIGTRGAMDLAEAMEVNQSLTELRLEGNSVRWEMIEKIEASTRRNSTKASESGRFSQQVAQDEALDSLRERIKELEGDLERVGTEKRQLASQYESELDESVRMKILEGQRVEADLAHAQLRIERLQREVTVGAQEAAGLEAMIQTERKKNRDVQQQERDKSLVKDQDKARLNYATEEAESQLRHATLNTKKMQRSMRQGGIRILAAAWRAMSLNVLGRFCSRWRGRAWEAWHKDEITSYREQYEEAERSRETHDQALERFCTLAKAHNRISEGAVALPTVQKGLWGWAQESRRETEATRRRLTQREITELKEKLHASQVALEAEQSSRQSEEAAIEVKSQAYEERLESMEHRVGFLKADKDEIEKRLDAAETAKRTAEQEREAAEKSAALADSRVSQKEVDMRAQVETQLATAATQHEQAVGTMAERCRKLDEERLAATAAASAAVDTAKAQAAEYERRIRSLEDMLERAEANCEASRQAVNKSSARLAEQAQPNPT